MMQRGLKRDKLRHIHLVAENSIVPIKCSYGAV